MLLDDLITDSLPGFLDLVLDFKGDDKKFVDTMKIKSSIVINKWIDELEEGFVDGSDDVIPFLKENVSELLKSACEPAKKSLVSMMGTGPIIKFIQESYAASRQEKEKSQPVDQPIVTQTPVVNNLVAQT